MKYNNPILPGFHPDPSVCRVGDDYYMVTSSFEYFPCIPVFHSTDLVNWEPIGHCITRNSQLTLMQGVPNYTGIYAPTIRYHDGIFYVITTNVSYTPIPGQDGQNFIVWTKDPYGDWSDPIWLDCPGIDPSLLFDKDGKVYYCGTDNGIYLCELDSHTLKRTSERQYIWHGTGGCCPEGPHLYHIDDWYYLLISEGGTELCHMITMARSKSIHGPYEPCPRNPILSNRSLPQAIKATGHADIFQDQNGNWWTVCLGIRPISYPFRHNLGRETMLIPMFWNTDGWPVMGNNGAVEETIDTCHLPLIIGQECTQLNSSAYIVDNFDNPVLNHEWNFIYNPVSSLWKLDANGTGLILRGNATSLSEPRSIAWIGRRQEHHICTATTKLHFKPEQELEEAGLTIYMNNKHHYEIALSRINNTPCLIFRRQIGTLVKIENIVTCAHDVVYLRMEANKENYTFSYSFDDTKYIVIGQGETQYITTEVGGAFTGNYIGMYASGNGKDCTHPATFMFFIYDAISTPLK